MKPDYFSNRHTIRKFDNRKVDMALLESIIDKAVHAPTTGNMQLYSAIATHDPEEKKKLAELHFNQPAATGAPLILTVCADLGRFSRWCRISGAKPGFGNFQGMMYAFLDAIIFAQQIVTIAENEGLGTCYLGTVTFNAEAIANMLDLPEMTVPVVALAIGYPAETGDNTERIGASGILYDGKYPDFSDQDIKEIYRVKDEFPANAGYAAEHGKPNIASVFTDVRYPEAMNSEFSAPFVEFLKKKGFNF